MELEQQQQGSDCDTRSFSSWSDSTLSPPVPTMALLSQESDWALSTPNSTYLTANDLYTDDVDSFFESIALPKPLIPPSQKDRRRGTIHDDENSADGYQDVEDDIIQNDFTMG